MDAVPRGAVLNALQDFFGSETGRRSGEHQLPILRYGFERFYQTCDVFPFLNGAYVKDQILTRERGAVECFSHAVVDHSDPASLHLQMLFHLIGSELGNRDDHVATLRRPPGAHGEQLAKFRSGVILRQHEQIVKRANAMLDPFHRHPLVEAVKQFGARNAEFIVQEKPATVSEQARTERPDVLLWTVAEEERGLRMGSREAG